MSEFLTELLRVRLFKSSQGKIARRLSMLGIAVIFLTGAYTLYYHMSAYSPIWQNGIPGAIAILGCWLAFRVVNYPPFADFLVSVEAEMMKVSWPSRNELYNSTKIVLIVLAILAALIYFFDIIWYLVFHYIGVI